MSGPDPGDKMLQLTITKFTLLGAMALFLVACGDESATTGAVPPESKSAKIAANPGTSPGKPSAPIKIDYEVLGKAVVGLPVSINVEVRGTRGDVGPVSVSYSINDRSALLFQEGQVVRLEISELREASMQQLTVVPQREGRLYVNVSAAVQTPGGAMIKSMAIPIQVGNAPEPVRTDAEAKTGPDGETVLSLPAEQN